MPTDYDWTGLQVITNIVPFAGPTQHDEYTAYIGQFTFLKASAGGSSGNSHVDFTINGVSTYYWDWVPPHNLYQNFPSNDPPNFALFPEEPIFCIAAAFRFSAVVADPSNVAGLDGHGYVANPWGDGATYYVVPGQAPGPGVLPYTGVADRVKMYQK